MKERELGRPLSSPFITQAACCFLIELRITHTVGPEKCMLCEGIFVMWKYKVNSSIDAHKLRTRVDKTSSLNPLAMSQENTLINGRCEGGSVNKSWSYPNPSSCSVLESLRDCRTPYKHVVLIDFNGILSQTADSKLSHSRYNIYRRHIILPQIPSRCCYTEFWQ